MQVALLEGLGDFHVLDQSAAPVHFQRQRLDIVNEARATRYIPGTGELPLAASLQALRQASVFSIELPAHLSLPDTPLSERLSRSADWLRQAL